MSDRQLRPERLASWHDDWRGLKVVVFGLGVTGFAAVDSLVELGADVHAVTESVSDERHTILEVLGAPITIATRDETPSIIGEAELVIASPGLPPTHPWLAHAAAAEIPIWGDIELAWRLRDKVHLAEWILVTGTNGKTTTTQLAAHILRQAGYRMAPVGNIGTAALDAIRDPQGFDVLVVELSSFQLQILPTTGSGALAPYASVCLNLHEDHLDVHGGMRAYRDAKAKVYAGTKVAAVYNLADEQTRRMVEEAEVAEGCRAIGFGLGVPGPSDFGLVDDIVVDRAFLEERRTSALEIAELSDLEPAGLRSPHMTSNVLAAAALTRSFGAAPSSVRDSLRSFRLDHHRTEFVAEIDGVRYVNDSKATNPHAADGSLAAFERVVWIVGGLWKGADVAPLVQRHVHRLEAAVVIGMDRGAALEAFARHAPSVRLVEVADNDTGAVMLRAVEAAASLASQGATVLLAPAAASFDQFDSYEDRGTQFAAAVRERGVRGHNRGSLEL